MSGLQTYSTAVYAAYKCYQPQFVNNELKYFCVSSGLFAALIGLDWKNVIPKSAPNMSRVLFGIGILYGSVGFYPQKLKYLLPVFALLKLDVFRKWVKKGCPPDEPNDAQMTIAVGDASFAVVFLIAFYNLYKESK